MFNLGVGDVIVIVVLALALLGPGRVAAPTSWRWSDWLLVGAVVVLGLAAILLSVFGR